MKQEGKDEEKRRQAATFKHQHNGRGPAHEFPNSSEGHRIRQPSVAWELRLRSACAEWKSQIRQGTR